MSIKIRYKDIAVGADTNATVTTTEKTGFSDTAQIPFGVNPPALVTCELNGWGLSPAYKARENHSIAFWSNELSGADCTFTNTPKITLEFTEQYTTTGLTIQFGVESFDFCRRIGVFWYQGEELKEQGVFTPTSPFFVLNKAVEAFDKLVFEFYETTLPRKRCKIEGIIIGVVRDFTASELIEMSAIHEIDLISATVPTNVLDATIHSTDEVDYIFQKKQPVEMTNNGNLIGVYFIESGERTGRLDMKFSCSDVIGLMELKKITGRLWLTDTPLQTILHDVFGDAYTFIIDSAYSKATLRGGLEGGKTEREALQHIAFALGAVVDTTGTRGIKIFPPSSGAASHIPEKETYTGGKVTTTDTVTGVELTAYDILDERPDDNDISISANGVKYKVKETIYTATNPNTVTSDPENIKKYAGCYLVNSSNAQALAYRIMTYHQKRDKYAFKHILDGQNVAGRYSAGLPWNKTVTGSVTRMTVTTSNITVSDTEMLLDE